MTAFGSIETAVRGDEARRRGLHHQAGGPGPPAAAGRARHRAAGAGPPVAALRGQRSRARCRRSSENRPRSATVRAETERVAATDATVLIEGESGTGKELVARAIHALSTRAQRPVRRHQLRRHPRDAARERALRPRARRLHRRRAAAGRASSSSATAARSSSTRSASSRRPLQAKLLRVLQERTFQRVGGTRPIAVDVRDHRRHEPGPRGAGRGRAASARTSTTACRVFPIRLPPLRERPEDIDPLVDWFLERSAAASSASAPCASLARPRERLRTYDWPGNVRELQQLPGAGDHPRRRCGHRRETPAAGPRARLDSRLPGGDAGRVPRTGGLRRREDLASPGPREGEGRPHGGRASGGPDLPALRGQASRTRPRRRLRLRGGCGGGTAGRDAAATRAASGCG